MQQICKSHGIDASGMKAELNNNIKLYFNGTIIEPKKTKTRTARIKQNIPLTLGNLLDIYYGKESYAKYDKVSLQWNKFVHDFCADPATASFPNLNVHSIRLTSRTFNEIIKISFSLEK